MCAVTVPTILWYSSSVSLKVNLNVKQGGKRLEHQGIRIEFVGQIGEHGSRDAFISVIVSCCVFCKSCKVYRIMNYHLSINSLVSGMVVKWCWWIYILRASRLKTLFVLRKQPHDMLEMLKWVHWASWLDRVLLTVGCWLSHVAERFSGACGRHVLLQPCLQ